jgi:hypothetical protein
VATPGGCTASTRLPPAVRAQVIVRRTQSDDEESETALTVPAARADHFVVEGLPKIFTDLLAAALRSDRADVLIAYHRTRGQMCVAVLPEEDRHRTGL